MHAYYQSIFQKLIPLCDYFPILSLMRDFVISRTQTRPERKMFIRWKPAHVCTNHGNNRLCASFGNVWHILKISKCYLLICFHSSINLVF